MRLRDIIGLVLALVLAIGVAFLTRLFLTKSDIAQKEVTAQSIEVTRVIIGAKDIPVGTKIKPGDLVWQEWPQKSLNPSYITEATGKIEEYNGAIVKDSVLKGEPIVAGDFIKAGDRGLLAALVAPGKYAISIDITPSSGSSGLIYPGDYVDVILSKRVTPEGGSEYGNSETIVTNVKVLAMDIDLSAPADKPKAPPHVATLEVDQGQAETITAAQKEGTLSLALRSFERKEATSSGKGLEHSNITIMRGNQRSVIPVQQEQQK
jgi:pilus assembly protein CpaB